MNRREYRIECMKFLYLLEMGSDYDENEIDPMILKAVKDLIIHNDEIEEILNRAMVGWKLSRMNLVDKAIMKYAVYEMKYLEIPYQVVINEALEITKIYSDIDGKQKAFTNKVLDKAKSLIYDSKNK